MTAVAFLVAVVWWGVDSLEQVSWVAGILGFAATVVIALLGQPSAPPPPGTASSSGAVPGRRWDRAPVRSGVGPVLGLGALGVTLIAAMVLGAAALLTR
ncbi:hypothetical protein ADL15_19025 [Actinoplanes awajinensis subsp. mycoplanecinus]|uniref:Uncharacterized protein n=1 Tax=Actinoplanes awajinensis subsp. mycoplanecinus TaxID=135947 RepID=A0A101JUE2_9ACTN|nr:hypothetical protein ADL15_19025 [Actinoplanes awajinensis subsp. mycoplanecinus]